MSPLIDDFDEYLSELYSKTSDYYEVLNKLENLDDEMWRELQQVQKYLDTHEEEALRYAANDVVEDGKEIFIENTRAALQVATEYDYPLFRDALFNLVKDSRLISVTKLSEGGGKVNINMTTVAGTLDEYLEGVKFARKVLREESKSSGMPPEAASKVWAEKIYGVDREDRKITRLYKVKGKKRRVRKDITERYRGKYKKTIELRLSTLAGLAPFWPLIEWGNMGFTEEGGGTPYPQFEGTHFVERTRVQLQNLFDRQFSIYVEQLYYKYIDQMDRIQRLRKQISDQIGYINDLLYNPGPDTPTSKGRISRSAIAITLLDEYLQEQRGIREDLQIIRESKALQRLLTGDPTRSYVGETRVRLIELRQELEDRIGNYIWEGYDIID